MNRTKLRKILGVLDPSTKIDFSSFDNDLNKLKEDLKQRIQPANFTPLTLSFNKLKKSFEDRNTELVAMISDRQKELGNLISDSFKENKDRIDELTAEVALLQARKIEIPDFSKQIKDTEIKLMSLLDTAKTIDDLEDEKEKEALQIQFANFERQIKELKLALQHRGGGSMNRKISINGTAVSTRYTDINFKGSGVTYSAVDNNTTKEVDLTLTSTGGGIAGTSNYELPLTGAIDDNNAVYTFTHTPQDILLNGAIQIPGGIDITVVGTTVTFITPPATGSTLYNKYLS